MNAFVFEGKEFAKEKEDVLKSKVLRLKSKGILPKMVILVDKKDPESQLYVSLKEKAAERVCVKLEVRNLSLEIRKQEIIRLIKALNKDGNVHGVMVQLPLPEGLRKHTREILELIDPDKDVDGLRSGSKYCPAAVKAVLSVLEEVSFSVEVTAGRPLKVVVVGAKGMVGRGVVNVLEGDRRYEVVGVDKGEGLEQLTKSADVIISSTGVEGLIAGDMVKEGVVAIDVGCPKGDFDFESVSAKASFVTPVPGGVGPVTIMSLMESLVESVG